MAAKVNWKAAEACAAVPRKRTVGSAALAEVTVKPSCESHAETLAKSSGADRTWR